MMTRGSEKEEEFESGFTWRSMLGMAYAICVFSPITIWLSLVTVGVGLGSAVQYCTLIVLVEYTRFSRNPLKKQEALVAFLLGQIGVSAGLPLDMIYKEYFRLHPYTNQFGVASFVPDWYAPRPETLVWNLRTFSNSAWLPVIVVEALFLVSSVAGGFFFALFLREIYIEHENLPFPIQQISYTAINTLTERKERQIDLLVVVAIFSLIYAAVLYTIPVITTAAGYPITSLPVPWYDFYLTVQNFLPGGSFGIATDGMLVGIGLLLPLRIVMGIAVGSFLAFLFINPLLVRMGWTEWGRFWVPGMNIETIWRESTLRFWVSPLIGCGLAVGIIPIILRSKLIVRTIKSFFEAKVEGTRISGEKFSIRVMLALFLLGTVGAVIFDAYLIPDFPLWIFIVYECALPFIIGLINGRMIGLTGQGFDIPYLRQLCILGSGYSKVDIWFLPMSLNPGHGWLGTFKIAQLTKTKVSSLIGAYLVGLPIGIIVSFIFTEGFWRIAPIPSEIFPAPAIQWPLSVINSVVWMTKPPQIFSVELISLSFVVIAASTLVFEFFRLPGVIVSIVGGINTPTPISLTMLIGALIGQIIAKLKGQAWYNEQKGIIAAGISIGEGIAIVFGVAMALIIKSSWIGLR